jgi:ribosomal-protein-alanine N-acetyltransferase
MTAPCPDLVFGKGWKRRRTVGDREVSFRTDRLLLRPATGADVAAFHRILGDPQAVTYWSSLPHRTVEETEAWVRSMIAIPPGDGEDFVVEHDGAVIGKAGFHRFPRIGFVLHPDHWGRGFAGEALRFVIDRAFRVHGLKRIEADVDPRNQASLACLARLGFTEYDRQERTWLIGGEWLDSVYLELRPD